MSNQVQQLGPVASRLLFENEHVNVWEMDVKPGETFGVHHHTNDYVLFITSGANLKVHEPDRRSYIFAALDRQAYFLPAGGMESFENLGQIPFKEVLIEVKTPRRPDQSHGFTSCSALVGMKPQPGLINIIENDRASVSELTLGPGDESGMCRSERNSAVFVVDGSKVRMVEQNEAEPVRSHEEECGYGAVRFLSAGVSRNLINVGKNMYRQVSVEIK